MSILEKLFGKNYKADKAAYRAYNERVENMPEDYKKTMKGIQKFLWAGAGDDSGSMDSLYHIEEIFQDGIAEGRNVKDITGDDVTGFALEIVKADGGKNYQDHLSEKWNKKINK